MTSRANRTGFSLAEILVAIAIVAVIAAVVVPSFGSQLRSGDEGRVQQDLTNIRSGIEQFLADVRRYPKSVGALTNMPDSTATNALVGGLYKGNQIKRWRGPYISKDSTSALLTGFDNTITATFDTATVNGAVFLRIQIAAFDTLNASRLDKKMDDGVLATGLLRWVVGTSPSGTLSYYAMPVQ
jgi:prepilin-type N-terminal cleavage/methylation domain-containing protein